jgi:hypothetical protein
MKELIHLFLKLEVITLILEIIKIFAIFFKNTAYEHSDTTKPSYGTNIIYSWSTPDQIGSGSGSSWHGPENTKPAGSPTSNTRFPTTKVPFNYGSVSDSTLSGSPYVGTGPKQPNFNIASSSAIANAGTSAFATSFNTYNTPGIIGATPSYGTTLAGRGTNYPGSKDSPGNIRPTYGTIYDMHPNIGNAWPGKRPDIGTGTSPNRYPENVGNSWPTKQPGISNEPRGKPEVGSSITPNKYPENYDGIWPAGRPESTSGTTPRYFGTGNGNKPIEQSTGGSGTWPDGQSKHGIGPGCSSVTCKGSTDSVGNSNCGNGNYNCGNNCKEDNYASTVHGPCTGSSAVQVYYPAGIGNIPNFGITHEPNSAPNIGTGIYPGTGCRNGNSCNQGT